MQSQEIHTKTKKFGAEPNVRPPDALSLTGEIVQGLKFRS